MATLNVQPAPTTAPPVPRWQLAAAVAVPLCVLPSAVWRVAQVIPDPSPCVAAGGDATYIVGLSVVSMAAALLTLGLVRPWGEVFPRWIPRAGGRPVPVRAATTTALVGATIIAAITAYAVLNMAFDVVDEPLQPVPPGCEPPNSDVAILYAPLLAWAPLLYLLTYHYHHRRTDVTRADHLTPAAAVQPTGGVSRTPTDQPAASTLAWPDRSLADGREDHAGPPHGAR